MTSIEYSIVIPTRYGSSRFPGKPLFELNGRAMILHVIDRARESSASRIVVATDDDRIAKVCADAGAQVQMTDPSHVSGTDRIAEVAGVLGWSDDTIIVGLQGDEPATAASLLDRLAANLHHNDNADMATFCTPVLSTEEYKNANRVKVVRNKQDFAMYFSRASIPAQRDAQTSESYPSAYIHVGLYAYRCHYLKQFAALPACYVEQQEQLEQLRVLYNGGTIHVDEIDEVAGGVDHPDDVSAIEKLLAQLPAK
jgi:3-deoxy-manno-octulosonate cytidylyltransferase (CMP-KDO synthetase)